MRIPPPFMASPTTVRSSEETKVGPMEVQRVESGTPEGDVLGFSEDLFSGWLEVLDDNRLYLHYIISRRRDEGNTQNLIRFWLSDGYDVRVVMPRPIMQHILRKFRFVPSLEYLPGQYRRPGRSLVPPEDPGSSFPETSGSRGCRPFLSARMQKDPALSQVRTAVP